MGPTEWRMIQEKIYEEEGGLCQYCGYKLGKTYTIDHIVPLRDGGTHLRRNLRLSCFPCNQFKGHLNIPSFKHRINSILKNPWLADHMKSRDAILTYNIKRRYGSISPLIFYYEREKNAEKSISFRHYNNNH